MGSISKRVFRNIHENLVLWVIGGSLFSFLLPSIFKPVKPFLEWFFAITMFCIGVLLNPEHLSFLWRKPHRMFAGTLMQYTIMPSLAFIASLPFHNENLKIGILIAGCVPGAMASNLMSALANADVVLSVSVTTLSTLFSPVVTPGLLYFLAGKFVKVDFFRMFINLLLMVVIPVCAGYLVKLRAGKSAENKKEYLAGTAGLAIILIVALVVAENRNSFSSSHLFILLALIFVNASGYFLGYLLPYLFRWPVEQRKTLSLEVGMQNAGLGTVLALSYFGGESAIPPAIYTVLCLLTSSILIKLWRVMERVKGEKPPLFFLKTPSAGKR